MCSVTLTGGLFREDVYITTVWTNACQLRSIYSVGRGQDLDKPLTTCMYFCKPVLGGNKVKGKSDSVGNKHRLVV